MVKPALAAGEQTGVCESIGPPVGLSHRAFRFWHAYSGRKHDELGSRDIDGQVCVGCRRVREGE